MKNKIFGFSLAEMMIVLLMVAISLAATAPMITKRVANTKSDKIFDQLLGNVNKNNGVYYVKGPGTDIQHKQKIYMHNTGDTGGLGIAVGDVNNSPIYSVLLGNDTNLGNYATSIGYSAHASENSIAIGYGATASNANSVAIGNGASASNEHEIVFGTASDTVRIPGNLIVGKNTVLGYSDVGVSTFIRGAKGNDDGQMTLYSGKRSGTDNTGCVLAQYQWENDTKAYYNTLLSDIRLKNVGEKFTGGLDALNKLDFYHFTFKNDKNKTPHVGVMAQDLQKVFPDAVKTGESGYLQIRWDEMFYSTINAVKELDTKLIALATKVEDMIKDLADIHSTIEKQQQTIEAQQQQINALSLRLEKLEQRK